MKKSEIHRNLERAFLRLDHSHMFICHAGDTDSLVSNLQKEIGDRNNEIDPYVRWSIIDWRRIPHIQEEGEKDCQDIINEYIDKAEHVLFIIKNRVGHYTIREWFYVLHQLRNGQDKRIYLFLDRDSNKNNEAKKIIDEVFLRGNYVAHNEYGTIAELINLFDKSIETPLVKDALHLAREVQKRDTDDEIKPYEERIHRLTRKLESDKSKRIATYLPENLLRLTNRSLGFSTEIHATSILTDSLRNGGSIPIHDFTGAHSVSKNLIDKES